MPEPRPPRRLYWPLALLFLAGALNLFDRQVINVLAEDIKRELAISDASLGLLTGTAFGLFYAVLGIPLGRLGDRVDRVKLIAASLALWSGFTIACGGAASFVQLFLARMGVGVGEAGSQPASTALVSDLFPEGRRTSAMSVMLIGAPAGGFLGLLVGGYVGFHWGWRTAFVVAGAPGLLVALIMLLTMRDPGREAGSAAAPASIAAAVFALARQGRYRWLALTLACSTFLPYVSGAWLPPMFIRVFGMTTAEIGLWSALAVGVGGALGSVAVGVLCDALRPRIPAVESKVLLGVMAISIPAILLVTLSPGRGMALAGLFAFNVCAYAWLAPTARLIQMAAPESPALALAIASSIASIFSLGLGLPLVGAISDHLALSYGYRSIAYAVAMTVPALSAFCMAAHVLALRRLPPVARPRPVPAAEIEA